MNLTENGIISPFIGARVNPDILAACARLNRAADEGDEYIVYSCGFLYDQAIREQFGVTEQLKEHWERRGTEFNLYLYVRDGIITACHISKFRDGDGPRSGYSPLKCTQQELRIARRILDYIT